MKIKFSYIIAISAFLVAGCAAYFSVFGLSQLFAGASMAVIIMASSLEFSKVIAVSLLQRYWVKISNALKIYLMVGVFILMCVTSAGIYGFLSNAYQKTASKYQISENEISVLTNKKAVFDTQIANTQTIITNKTKRVEQLSNFRTNQETRLDSAKSSMSRARARADIADGTNEIKVLNKEIDSLNAKNAVLADSANSYSSKAIDSKSKTTATGEIGPLKYLAALTGYPMDKVVNWFILLLIFVFDPLAVALVISFNRILQIEHEAETPSIKDIVKPTTLGVVGIIEDPIPAKESLGPLTGEFNSYKTENIVDVKESVVSENIESEIIPVETPDESIVPDVSEITEPEIIPLEVPKQEIIEAPDARYIKPSVVETPKIPVASIEAPDARYVNSPVENNDTINDAIRELTKEDFKQEPVIPTGRVELNDIKEIKETNRFSDAPNNAIERVSLDNDRIYKRK